MQNERGLQMIQRRSLLTAFASAIASLPFLGRVVHAGSVSDDFVRSMDAREWARAFVAHAKRNPSIATDEDTMIAWFANAIMKGYDEGQSHAVERQLERQGELSGSEAVYGFGGWLTTCPEPLVLSAAHDASNCAVLADRFCRENNLQPPRPYWERKLRHPKM